MLRQPTQLVDVTELEHPDVQVWIDDMILTMNQANGIGLAAPQVGRSLRLTVISPSADPQLEETLVLVNPTILQPSLEQAEEEEGCLSIIGVYGQVPRAMALTVRAMNRHGRLQTISASGLLARVIQHEVDHLDGVLFIDRASKLTKGQHLIV